MSKKICYLVNFAAAVCMHNSQQMTHPSALENGVMSAHSMKNMSHRGPQPCCTTDRINVDNHLADQVCACVARACCDMQLLSAANTSS